MTTLSTAVSGAAAWVGRWLRDQDLDDAGTGPSGPPPGPRAGRLAALLAVTAAVVVGHNVLVARYDPGPVYTVAGVVLAGVALAAARDPRGRGVAVARRLPLGRVRPALPWLVAAVFLATLLWGTDAVRDAGIAAEGIGGLVARSVDTLFGVAVVEEVIFRQWLLVGWSRAARRPPRGIGPAGIGLVASSVAFGLWHVAAEVDRLGDPSAPAVLGAVAVTGLVAGPFLAVVRLRAGGLLAPVLVHAGFNLAVTVGVWL